MLGFGSTKKFSPSINSLEFLDCMEVKVHKSLKNSPETAEFAKLSSQATVDFLKAEWSDANAISFNSVLGLGKDALSSGDKHILKAVNLQLKKRLGLR